MWGKHITLPDRRRRERLTDRAHRPDRAERGRTRCRWARSGSSSSRTTPGPTAHPTPRKPACGGFQVGLEEQTHSAVTVDYNNNPLCGGICLTDGDGFVQIDNLGPATYFIDVHPPDRPCNSDPDSRWYQTTTIDGGLQLLAPIEEGSDGTGAPGEQLWEPPNVRTAYWFGFVCAPQPFATAGTGEITGTARNWAGLGAVHDRHLRRAGREPVRGADRRHHRPDRVRRPGRRAAATSTSRTSRPAATTWPSGTSS